MEIFIDELTILKNSSRFVIMKLLPTLFPSCTFTFRFYNIYNTGHSAKEEESMQVGYMVSQGNQRKTIENRASRKHNKNQVDTKNIQTK